MATSDKISKNLQTEYKNSQQPPPTLLQKTQKQVDELVEIVYDNVDQAMQRNVKLNDLNDIAENLENGAGQFKTSTVEIKRKELRKLRKTRIICMVITVILLLIIIGLLAHML